MARGETKRQLGQVLRFEAALGADELNVAEFPLAAITHRLDSDVRTLTFEDKIFDEGNQQPVHRKLVISASDHFGLPTPRDSDVLLVLLYLTNLRNGLTDRTVRFSRYELVKLLGWDQGGRSYRRLDESLNRWAGVTLYYNHAWWDRSGRKWRSRTFHVIESVELRSRDDRDDDALSSCTWNEVLFQSLEANNLKRLDLELYFRLQNPAARQAFRFLDKRFYCKKHLEFDLRTFACEHVGFARSYDTAQLKRRLQSALDELESVGFLESLPAAKRYQKRGRGDWVILLNKARQTESLIAADVEKQPTQVDLLIARGVSRARAGELCRQFSAERIAEKLRYLDWLVAKQDRRVAKNPPGFLIEAIRQDYPLPRELGGHRKPLSQPSCLARPRVKSVEQQHHADSVAKDYDFDRFWSGLDESSRAEYEQAAIAAAESFHAATYHRLRTAGGALFDSFRRELVANHLRRAGILPVVTSTERQREAAGGPSEKV